MKVFRFVFTGSMEIAAHCNEDALDAFRDACAEAGVAIENFGVVAKPDLEII